MDILSKELAKTQIFVERYGRIWYNNSKEVLSFRASACFFRRVAAAIATPPIWYRGGGSSPAPPSISWALVCMIWFNSKSQDHPEREKIKYERW